LRRNLLNEVVENMGAVELLMSGDSELKEYNMEYLSYDSSAFLMELQIKCSDCLFCEQFFIRMKFLIFFYFSIFYFYA